MTTSSIDPGGDASPGTPTLVRAVFLSYASEDAPAAQRICAALRAAGIEVWFDQSELRGGDAWDRAIRRQIKSCALFLPIISANAHARIEGYFRLEWKLAVDRSHLLAPDQAFLVPVAIDQTPQSDERLPDLFRELQWTRLPEGYTPPEFVARIKRLLSSDSQRDGSSQRASAAPSARDVHGAPVAQSPAARPPWLLPAIVAAALAAAGIAWFSWWSGRHTGEGAGVPVTQASAAPAQKSVAVLPFADDSANKDQGYFSDGLSDELIDLLGKIPQLRVPARTSSFYFKGRQATLAEIGSMLKVANVLEGSVRKSGSALRVSAELIRVSDDSRVWSETYDRPLDDVFKVQDDIANSVVAALKVSMLGEPKARAAPTSNSDAYLHYLRAFEGLKNGSTTPAAIFDELHQALRLDPSFAAAWQALATAQLNGFAGSGVGTYEDVRRDALAALQRSLALDPAQAATHAELARLYYQLDYDAAAARPELQRALQLDPNNVPALWLSGYMDNSEGRFTEALAMHQRVHDLDPLFADNYRQLANVYYRSGQLTDAAAVLRETLQRFPGATTVHYRLGLVLLAQQMPREALNEFDLEQQGDFRLLGMPLALARLGRRAEGDRLLAQALQTPTVTSGAAYQVALVYAVQGNSDQAFQWLEHAYRQRDAGMHWMKYDPLLQPLKGDPRFNALLAEMHMN